VTAKFTIYCHTNRVNGKRYVGQTLSTMEKRWTAHVSVAKCNRGRQTRLLSAAIRKYGPDAFDHEVLEIIVGTQEEADLAEAEWIKRRGSRSPAGYNLTAGGGSRGLHHESTKQLLRLAAKKQLAAMSPEQRAEFFKKSIHKSENWTPERIARQLACLRSEKANKKRQIARPLQAEKVRKFQLARQATLTVEQKSEIAKRAWRTRRANFNDAAIRQMSRAATSRFWANLTPEARAEMGRKMSEGRRRNKMSDEAATEKAKKAWKTRLEKYGPKGHKLDAELVPFVRHWHKRGHSVESIARAFDTSTSEVERAVA
jgi:group I intron endonuclease